MVLFCAHCLKHREESWETCFGYPLWDTQTNKLETPPFMWFYKTIGKGRGPDKEDVNSYMCYDLYHLLFSWNKLKCTTPKTWTEQREIFCINLINYKFSNLANFDINRLKQGNLITIIDIYNKKILARCTSLSLWEQFVWARWDKVAGILALHMLQTHNRTMSAR